MRQKERMEFLTSTTHLKNFSKKNLAKIADEVDIFEYGENFVKERDWRHFL